MLVTKTRHGYRSKRKYVHGQGFIDSLKNMGSYIVQNKDLLAKPLLGAVGDLTAFGLTEGGKALITKLINARKKENTNEKSDEILQNILGVSNIIGSGIKQF